MTEQSDNEFFCPECNKPFRASTEGDHRVYRRDCDCKTAIQLISFPVHSYYDPANPTEFVGYGCTKPETAASLRAEIERLTAEVDRLRGAIHNVLEGNVSREVWQKWRTDGKPSKNDQCKHALAMYDDCPNCVDEYLAAVLDDHTEVT